jgi:type I restriction enzyme, S subunit
MNEVVSIDLADAIESKIDRSKWQLLKFSDLAENIVEKVVPKESGLKHYIGLEHLDSGSLHIKCFGETASLIGDKLKIYKGDLIFAKRNAYLKRVAIAEFDAVASAHSMVLRAKSQNVLPEFLPFFMLSEIFWKRAIEISVGSLSPTINWKALAKQEFLIPPKDQQEQIAELLWAADEMIEKNEVLVNTLKESYQTVLENLFDKRNHNWDVFKLSKVANVNAESLRSSTDPNFTFKYLDIAGIIEPKVIGKLEQYTFSTAPSRARRKLKDGSIVLSLVRPYHKSFVLINNATGIIASTGTGVVDSKESILNRFLFHQFFTKRFDEYCEVKMSGTNYPAITPNDLKDFEIFVPRKLEEQVTIANKLDSFDKNIIELKGNLHNSKILHKSIINQVF